jgi:hypothetical protein
MDVLYTHTDKSLKDHLRDCKREILDLEKTLRTVRKNVTELWTSGPA